MRNITRADKIIRWIEKFCVTPSGPERGQFVRLSIEEAKLIRRIYDEGERLPVSGALASYLVLMHLCGPEHGSDEPPIEKLDVFTLWNAAGQLKPWLERDGEVIRCPGLGSSYPKRAA